MGAHEGCAGLAALFVETSRFERFAGSRSTPVYLDSADVDGDGDVDLVESVIGAAHAIGLLGYGGLGPA